MEDGDEDHVWITMRECGADRVCGEWGGDMNKDEDRIEIEIKTGKENQMGMEIEIVVEMNTHTEYR